MAIAVNRKFVKCQRLRLLWALRQCGMKSKRDNTLVVAHYHAKGAASEGIAQPNNGIGYTFKCDRCINSLRPQRKAFFRTFMMTNERKKERKKKKNQGI